MRHFVLSCLVPLALAAGASAQTPEELIKRLKDPDARTRRLAAEAIGTQKVEAAARDLAALLGDREAPVRDAAVAALVRLGPKGVPALADGLSLPDEAGRVAAVKALGRCGAAAKTVVPALAAALKDKAVNVRLNAAVTQGGLGPDAGAALPALTEAGKDLGSVNSPAYTDLPPGVAAAAVAAALKIDPEGADALARAVLPDLTAALKSPKEAEVTTAAAALGALGTAAEPAVPALREALKTAGPTSEMALAAALRAAGAPDPTVAVIVDAKVPVEKRVSALFHLRFSPRGDAQTLDALKETLKDPDPKVRAAAAAAVESLGPAGKDLVPALLKLLGDRDVKTAAGRSLLGDRDAVSNALAAVGPDAIPGLVEAFKDQATSRLVVRWDAAKALGRMGHRARTALPALEAAMKDRVPLVAAEAAAAFVRVGGDPAKAVPVLRRGLKDDLGAVLSATAVAVGRLGPRAKELVPSLVPLLDHQEREVRVAAVDALAAMGEAGAPGVEGIVKLLASDDDRERTGAVRALRGIGPAANAAVPQLVRRLDASDFGTSYPVLLALAAMGPDAREAVPALTEMLTKSKDRLLTGTLVDVLGAIGPDARGAVPRLVPHLGHGSPGVRGQTATALGQVGPAAEEAVPALKGLLGDESKSVRVRAVTALARVTGDAKTYVPLLVEWWKDDAEEERATGTSLRPDLAAAFALLGADARPARDLLVEAVREPATPWQTRHQAARALDNLGDDADAVVPKMVELLERPLTGFARQEMYGVALEALALLGPKAKESVPAVRRLLDDDDAVADAAAGALEKIEKKP